MGGTLCILGTSANLLVVSLVQAKDPTIHLVCVNHELEKLCALILLFFFTKPLMEIGAVGTPIMFIGIAYIVIFGRWLLPDRSNGMVDLMKAPREYPIYN